MCAATICCCRRRIKRRNHLSRQLRLIEEASLRKETKESSLAENGDKFIPDRSIADHPAQ
jgi:hypothetical protein